MQGAEHASYRLFPAFGRPAEAVWLRVGQYTGRGAGQLQVRAHSFATDSPFDKHPRVRYPNVAAEVLCSEIWSIVETCLNNVDKLLVPFWDSTLDRSPDVTRAQIMTATHFAKVNATFLMKKPTEVFLAFSPGQMTWVDLSARCWRSFAHNQPS